MITRWMMVWLLVVGVAGVHAAEYRFLSEPDISPDGRTVVFCYNGDIWQVSATGGTAYRLTAMEGIESRPRISPDGRWLAFSGMADGNANVYVMPLAGGTITRLTDHEAPDSVDSWGWNADTIYFTSRMRVNQFTAYAVSRKGGTPRRLINGYFNTIHGVVAHPKDGTIAFTDSWESLRFADRRGYKGPFNPDILSYNLDTKELKVLTHWDGKDFFPSYDRFGRLFFISDEADPTGGVTNLYTLDHGVKRQLTRLRTSVRNPRVSADGSQVVFESEYRLFLYDVKDGVVRPLDVRLFQDATLATETSYDVKGKITAFDVSPDGKKLAFVSRGELFVSGNKGKFVRHLRTRVTGRVVEVKWLKDSRTLLFNQTVGGWLNWFTIPADGSGTEKRQTTTRGNDRNLSMNRDRTRAVYLSGLHEVRELDLQTWKIRTMAREDLWGFYNSTPHYSPDDAWVVFTAYRNFEEDIFLIDRKRGVTVNLTDTGISETGPVFSDDGKYLYVTSDRVHPNYPRGAKSSRVYRIALEKFDTAYRSDAFDKLFSRKEEEKEKAPAAGDKKNAPPAPPIVRINLDRVLDRFERVSPDTGRQGVAFVQVKKDTHTVIYPSDHEGKRFLYETVIRPFEKPKTRRIERSAVREGAWDVVSVKGRTYVLLGGTIHTLNPEKPALKVVDISYGFSRNMRAEFNQMFEELWANLNDNYYDPNFHGRDWSKIRERYRRWLPYVTNRNDFRKLVSDMLGELNSSHVGFYSSGKEEKTFHRMVTATVGLVYDRDEPFRVARVLRDGPLDHVEQDVRQGDVLTAVNGVAVDPTRNRNRYFRFPKLPREMALTFRRKETRTFTVRVHPESARKYVARRFTEWEDLNQQRVDRATDKRIAYIYMRDMGESELNRFLVQMTSEAYRRKGLILDLRNNMGGNVHDAVLNFLSRRLYAKWKYRGDDRMAPQPAFTPADGPIVLLVNRMTLSDGEMTATGFKALKLGAVVGTPTYRWLIFTSGKRLVDGSYYRLPSWGCFTVDGRDIERIGVMPDVIVPLNVRDKDLGNDPQLDRAIEIAMKGLAKQ